MHDENRAYMSADNVYGYVQSRLAVVAPTPKSVPSVKGGSTVVDSVKVFGTLRGRFRQVLVEFYTGKLAPQGSLNAGIVLGARALWLEQVGEYAAADILGEYVRDLPDVGVSGRLERGEYDEIDRVIRNTVRAVYRDNGGQADRDISATLLARTAEAWRRAGFRFSDKSTWATANSVTETPQPVAFTESTRKRIARPMADDEGIPGSDCDRLPHVHPPSLADPGRQQAVLPAAAPRPEARERPQLTVNSYLSALTACSCR